MREEQSFRNPRSINVKIKMAQSSQLWIYYGYIMDMDIDMDMDISLFQDKMASKTCTEDGTWWIHPDSNRFQTFSSSYELKLLCFN